MGLYRTMMRGCLAATCLMAAACGSSDNNTSGSTEVKPIPAGLGQLAINLVDAPNPEVSEIWVNISRVTVHSTTSGWVTVSSTPLKVDLLKLQSQVQALGLVNLPPGSVTQIRLYVTQDGNYVVTGGQQVALKVPSGSQSGIKIKGPFAISACAQMAVTLDFDGKKSIALHPTGHGDEWILRPVIRVKKSESIAVGCTDQTTDAGNTEPEPCVSESQNGCLPGNAGTACTEDGQCLSGLCVDGDCLAGGPGAPCKANSDCTTAVCQEDQTCAPGDAGSEGVFCTGNEQCLSNSCLDGACQAGVQGVPCVLAADCQSEVCEAGFCAVIIPN